MKKLLFVSLVSGFLISCAHHKDVRPSGDGVHRVSVQTDDKGVGGQEAMKQAEHYCNERNQSAVIVEENQKYNGSMDEKTYNTAKTVSKVAQGVGSAAWVVGGKKESEAGGVVGLGGAVAGSALGDGYNVEMKFKCM